MGCFGYICKGCGTAIRGNCYNGGELCVMKHVRHGEVLGEVIGHYDEYGRVVEEEGKDNRFRGEGSGINSHKEICKSEFEMADSLKACPDRIVDEVVTPFMLFYLNKRRKCTDENTVLDNEQDIELRNVYQKDPDDFTMACYELFETYPLAPEKAKSGIVAWHKKCYDKATDEERADLTPSKSDPEQSWGKIRKKFK